MSKGLVPAAAASSAYQAHVCSCLMSGVGGGSRMPIPDIVLLLKAFTINKQIAIITIANN